MPVQKPNKADSVRKQWTQQRTGEAQRSSHDVPAAGGSHFAAPAGGDIPLATSAGSHAKATSSASQAPSKPSLANIPSLGETGAIAKVSAAPEPAVEPQKKEKPSAPRTKRPPAQAAPYSRYNNRYRTGGANGVASALPAGMGAAASQERPTTLKEWLPFIIYGGVSVVASIAWCALVRTLITGPLEPGDLPITLGLVILCIIVLAGIALAVVVTKFTQDDTGLSFVDAFAPAIGKTALVMLVGIIVWVAASAVVGM